MGSCSCCLLGGDLRLLGGGQTPVSRDEKFCLLERRQGDAARQETRFRGSSQIHAALASRSTRTFVTSKTGRWEDAGKAFVLTLERRSGGGEQGEQGVLGGWEVAGLKSR